MTQSQLSKNQSSQGRNAGSIAQMALGSQASIPNGQGSLEDLQASQENGYFSRAVFAITEEDIGKIWDA
jgi:hypothetical protein